jgi:hypothetical protein
MNSTEITRLALSIVVTLGLGGVLIAWIWFPPSEATTNRDLLAGLTGAIAYGYSQVLNYWFGKASN